MTLPYGGNMDTMQKHRLGCVADDFTGASDAASFLQKAGMRTILINETPDTIEIPEETDAVVIALKSRTQEKTEAVESVLRSVQWLKNAGADKFYFKYCSTFDSTKEGNIGPVADAMMEELGADYTILCPALPINGRVVKEGRLYVNGVPLDESPMKNHPLTPMWDSRIKNLIEAQGKYQAIELFGESLKEDKESVQKKIQEQSSDMKHFYVVPDYENEEDAKQIVRLFGDLVFLTGGSGILNELGKYMLEENGANKQEICQKMEKNELPGVVLAGSCSVATLGQIADYQEKGNVSYRINPVEIFEGKQTTQEIVDFILSHPEEAVLVYSSDNAENVKEVQKLGKEKIADLLEKTISEVAATLVSRGYGRIVVAGGETSGAVTKALGYDAFEIGESIAPGVPVMKPVGNTEVKLALKSGNFGQPDFFTRALNMMKGKE